VNPIESASGLAQAAAQEWNPAFSGSVAAIPRSCLLHQTIGLEGVAELFQAVGLSWVNPPPGLIEPCTNTRYPMGSAILAEMTVNLPTMTVGAGGANPRISVNLLCLLHPHHPAHPWPPLENE
jgi:hypothetical protein